MAETDDPHGEFAGRNILFAAHSVEETARKFGRDVEEVQAGLLQARRKLLAARQTPPAAAPRRQDPHRLERPHDLGLRARRRGARRARATPMRPRAPPNSFSSACTIPHRARCSAAAATARRPSPASSTTTPSSSRACSISTRPSFDLRYLKLAVALTKKQCELFEDRAGGGFYSTAADDPDLVLRIKEDYDGAEPSGNSIAVLNLLRLARMTGSADFRESAERALAGLRLARRGRRPPALPQMLAACEFALSPPREVVVVGAKSSPDTLEMLKVLHTRFLPDHVLLLVDGEEARQHACGLAAGDRRHETG